MYRFSTHMAALLLGSTLLNPAAWAQSPQRLVTIGTGGVTGVYYAAGNAICRMMNKERATYGIRCTVESTSGSTYNINTIRSGSLDFGVVQSDTQFNALKGLGQFKEGGAHTNLRVVFSIYPEALSILARMEARIEKFEDFKGKRFSIGAPDSGTRMTVDMLLAALGMKLEDFAQVAELKPDEHGVALCSNKIDGFAFVVGTPAANIQDATTTCGAKLIPVSGPAIDKLLEKHTYLAPATIPGGIYPGNPTAIRTIGVMASFVTSASVPEDVVYAMVAAVFNNFDEFKKLHPALANLDPKDMVRNTKSAPLHPGAIKYYREKGWIEAVPEAAPAPAKPVKKKNISKSRTPQRQLSAKKPVIPPMENESEELVQQKNNPS